MPPPYLDYLGYKYQKDNYLFKEYGHLIHNAKLLFMRAVAKSLKMFISLYSCPPVECSGGGSGCSYCLLLLVIILWGWEPNVWSLMSI